MGNGKCHHCYMLCVAKKTFCACTLGERLDWKRKNDSRYLAAFLRNPRPFFAGAAQSSVPVQDGCHPGGRGSRVVGEEGGPSSPCLALLCKCVGTSVWMDCTPLELCERLCLYLLSPLLPPPHPLSISLPAALSAPVSPLATAHRLSQSSFTFYFCFFVVPPHSPKTNSYHLPSPPVLPPCTSFWPLLLPLSASLVDSVMRALVDDGALGDLPLDPASVRCRDGGGLR